MRSERVLERRGHLSLIPGDHPLSHPKVACSDQRISCLSRSAPAEATPSGQYMERVNRYTVTGCKYGLHSDHNRQNIEKAATFLSKCNL